MHLSLEVKKPRRFSCQLKNQSQNAGNTKSASVKLDIGAPNPFMEEFRDAMRTPKIRQYDRIWWNTVYFPHPVVRSMFGGAIIEHLNLTNSRNSLTNCSGAIGGIGFAFNGLGPALLRATHFNCPSSFSLREREIFSGIAMRNAGFYILASVRHTRTRRAARCS